MSFLAPLFLIGAATVVLPVVFHLVRRTTRHRTLFSSLLFLSPSPPRVTQRSRLEDLLLLLLRCLAIGLLAFGFARPFLRSPAIADPTVHPPSRVVLLVDTSASMRRAGLWEAAKARVIARARAAAPNDELAVYGFDQQAHALIRFSEWDATPAGDRVALVTGRIAGVEPGWGATHFDDAIITATELLAEKVDGPTAGLRQVVLISDLQEGGRLSGLQAFEWPKGTEVIAEIVKSRSPNNAGLQWVADSSAIPATTQTVVRVRVVNAPQATRDRFEVGWSRADGQAFLDRAQEVQVSPGQAKIVSLPVPVDATVQQVLLRGDDDDFDNHVYLVPPGTTPVHALYLGSESVEDQHQPLYFLRRAFPPTGRLAVDLIVRRPVDELESDVLRMAAMFFVTDLVPDRVAEQLREQIRSGKTLVFAPKKAEAFGTLQSILGAGAINASEATPRNYAMLGSIDFRHPLLSPFADPRFSDFTKIHFWKYRHFDDGAISNAHCVARFDSGEPALVDVAFGRGRVVIFASGWHPDDSQLALSTKFVPLLLSLGDIGTGRSSESTEALVVGDTLPLAFTRATVTQMRLPGGTTVSLPAGSTNFTEATSPGIYEILDAQAPEKFAVNLDGSESRTAPMPVETLEGFGATLGRLHSSTPIAPQKRQQLAAIETEGRQELWRWLIVATVAALLVESAMAGWQGRRLVTGKEILP